MSVVARAKRKAERALIRASRKSKEEAKDEATATAVAPKASARAPPPVDAEEDVTAPRPSRAEVKNGKPAKPLTDFQVAKALQAKFDLEGAKPIGGLEQGSLSGSTSSSSSSSLSSSPSPSGGASDNSVLDMLTKLMNKVDQLTARLDVVEQASPGQLTKTSNNLTLERIHNRHSNAPSMLLDSVMRYESLLKQQDASRVDVQEEDDYVPWAGSKKKQNKLKKKASLKASSKSKTKSKKKAPSKKPAKPPPPPKEVQ